MARFAFIVHPLEVKDVYKVVPVARFLPDMLIKFALRFIAPVKLSNIKITNINNSHSVEGCLILCPLLPQQMLALNTQLVISKIVKAAKLGAKQGAKIIGLGAYTSVVGDKGVSIAKQLQIPVTTGNSLTVAMIVDACNKAAESKKIDIRDSKIAVIGATGSIGSALCKLFTRLTSQIVVCAPNEKRLNKLKNQLTSYSEKTKVEIEIDPKVAVEDADIVVTASSSPNKILEFIDFKNNAIVCDVSAPTNISLKYKNERPDIHYFKGGLVNNNSHLIKLGVDIGLPENVVYACMAETMVLSLEEKYTDFSLGMDLDIDQIMEIFKLSERHGFYALQ